MEISKKKKRLPHSLRNIIKFQLSHNWRRDKQENEKKMSMLTLAGPCDLSGMDFVTKTFQTQAALTLSGHTCGLPAFPGITPPSPRENDLPVLSASNLLASHHP